MRGLKMSDLRVRYNAASQKALKVAVGDIDMADEPVQQQELATKSQPQWRSFTALNFCCQGVEKFTEFFMLLTVLGKG